jgi:hypothetical protein
MLKKNVKLERQKTKTDEDISAMYALKHRCDILASIGSGLNNI